MSILKDYYVGQMKIKILNSYESMVRVMSCGTGICLRALLLERRHVNVMFVAALSQNEAPRTLLSHLWIGWSRIGTLLMDEYVCIVLSPKARFRNFLKTFILNLKNSHSPDHIGGNTPKTENKAVRYATQLADIPSLDLCLIGIGENVHAAFDNLKTTDFSAFYGVWIVEPDEVCRMHQVHDRCFGRLVPIQKSAFTRAQAVMRRLSGRIPRYF